MVDKSHSHPYPHSRPSMQYGAKRSNMKKILPSQCRQALNVSVDPKPATHGQREREAVQLRNAIAGREAHHIRSGIEEMLCLRNALVEADWPGIRINKVLNHSSSSQSVDLHCWT